MKAGCFLAARYLSLVVDGRENRDAAWYYPRPKPAAAQIAGRVAFWKSVRVAPGATGPATSVAQRVRSWLHG